MFYIFFPFYENKNIGQVTAIKRLSNLKLLKISYPVNDDYLIQYPSNYQDKILWFIFFQMVYFLNRLERHVTGKLYTFKLEMIN